MVPANWVHPKVRNDYNSNTYYPRIYKESFSSAFATWLKILIVFVLVT